MKNIVLIGFMGSGKTAVGRALAARLGREFIDTDDEIKKITGKTPAELITREGEASFRSWERRVVNRIASLSDKVVATGGGVVLNRENVKALKKNGVLVLLRAEVAEICRRVAPNVENRPLLAGPGELADKVGKLLLEREKYYRQAADLEIRCGCAGVAELACLLEKQLKMMKVVN